ncbi:hypothetical protein AB0B45_32315 [Nonomuraea sp. NPDC049152]|uniref:hypothetical protein n=1 Tax=Nonomuraea sp. NPDC049152 TaxID=3154350 RepID=UPI0034002856
MGEWARRWIIGAGMRRQAATIGIAVAPMAATAAQVAPTGAGQPNRTSAVAHEASAGSTRTSE